MAIERELSADEFTYRYDGIELTYGRRCVVRLGELLEDIRPWYERSSFVGQMSDFNDAVVAPVTRSLGG